MRKIRIEPYKTWSGGAKALGKRCGILRATKRQVAKHGDFDVIINWGRTERRFNGKYINEPARVAVACDKKASLALLEEKGVPVPPSTDEQSVAQAWLEANEIVVVRKLLRANSGRGISLVTPESNAPVPPAPLYTKYVKKGEEYRVHVFKGKVIDAQQKKRKLEVPDEEVNFQIRNNTNGWIFARNDINLPECVADAAVAATEALGLDFGAVDVGYNVHYSLPCVYEVNSAPGLEGTTLDKYSEAFRQLLPVINSGAYKRRRSQRGG